MTHESSTNQSRDWREVLSAWCFAVAKKARGRAALSNLLYDAEQQRIPKQVLLEFLKDVAQRWEDNERESLERDKFLKEADKIFREAIEARAEVYLCQGKEAAATAPEQYSRVITTKDLVEHHLRPSTIPFPITGSLTSDQVRFLEEYGLCEPQGKIRGTLPIAWVTRTDDLARVRSLPDPADAARKNLGLLQFKEDEHLVEIRYPEGEPSASKLSAPTALEGCPSLVFRCKTDDEGWGYAVNLETLDDGFPEAIHWEIDLTDTFELRDLGRLPPLRPEFDWQSFLESLPRRWASEFWEDFVKYVQ